jgi:hypothetical protein
MKEKFPEQQYNENISQETAPSKHEEFFATEAGTVAGRENMDRLSRRVENMLNEGDDTIANIEKRIEEIQERMSSEEEGFEKADDAARTYAFQNPDHDPKKQTEYVSFLNRTARERSRKAKFGIAKLSELSQKLEKGTFDAEDIKTTMEYLRIPNVEERMAVQMFLGRVGEAKRMKKEEGGRG